MTGGTAPLGRTAGGWILRVRATPGAPRTRVQGVHGGALKIAVQAPPERGKANDELVRFLAQELGLARADVRLKSGAAARDKVFTLAAESGDALARAVERLLGGLA